jgi:hypothetical protein
MKYVRTAGFLIDLRRLPAEHRKLFVLAVHALLRPALDAGAHTGAVPWPRALRIHRIGANYSMTWSFASPDGRALFKLAEVKGRPSSCGYASETTRSTTREPLLHHGRPTRRSERRAVAPFQATGRPR